MKPIRIPDLINNDMTLLDWFAGQALAGIVAAQQSNDLGTVRSSIPKLSYDYAEALMAERQRRMEKP